MLIISAGMQKSGSAYIYNLINDLLIESGNKDARDIKRKYHLEKVMKNYNNNIGPLNNKLLLKLVFLSLLSGRYVVKTHNAPNKLHNFLLKLGLIKSIYIYRDPRDALLSAQDHGQRLLDKGKKHTFAKMMEFDAAFEKIRKWVKVFQSYSQVNGIVMVRYEDLLVSPLQIVKQICEYLHIHLEEEKLKSIVRKYDQNNPDAELDALHYNVGKSQRYKTELSPEQISFFKQELQDELVQMGYEV